MELLFTGNCQLRQMMPLFRITIPNGVKWTYHSATETEAALQRRQEMIDKCDVLVTNTSLEKFTVPSRVSVLKIPDLQFGGFHPDQTYVSLKRFPGRSLRFFGATPVSALAFWGYSNGFPPEETEKLFCADVFERLGYFDYFELSQRALEARFNALGFDCSRVLHELNQPYVSMYGAWHPKISLTSHLADSIHEKIDLRPKVKPSEIAAMVNDMLSEEYVWAVYPPIADYLGVPGAWVIRQRHSMFGGLRPYLKNMYHAFDKAPKGQLVISSVDRDVFDMARYDRVLGTA